MGEIEGSDHIQYKPYENSGIKEGDRIISINQNTITCTADLVNEVNASKGSKVDIQYIREEETLQTSIVPAKGTDNKYKLGLWVRDAAAGVGTVSFYEPETKTFAALGHGIQDVDTGQLLEIAKGDFVTTKIVSIIKGKKGIPGKIQGSIENSTVIGQVSKNTEFGVFGTLNNTTSLNINVNDAMEVASRDEIKEGKASIICTLEDGKKKEYEVVIQKIYRNNNENNKSMLIKVTDSELLEKTGGIIQGMSGSPIIQNNKVVGALTHVLVGDPETGYGVFADLMIKQSREVQ
ncbi:MAG: SpoIVB peptidase [Clostridia bacterium]|nr:SpoIVB peptidase [Clostridia bacterium]